LFATLDWSTRWRSGTDVRLGGVFRVVLLSRTLCVKFVAVHPLGYVDTCAGLTGLLLHPAAEAPAEIVAESL
jgi:hypothetical protein